MVDDMDVGEVVIELYGLAPEQFTAARNRVAKAAGDAGDGPGSAAIKALRKPTLAAWLANLLVRAQPEGQPTHRTRRGTATSPHLRRRPPPEPAHPGAATTSSSN